MEQFFCTSDLDLAAFLMLHGLIFVDAKIDVDHKRFRPKATMRFADDRQIAKDLERSFQTSTEKRYRDCVKYMLREAHTAVNEYTKESIQESEENP